MKNGLKFLFLPLKYGDITMKKQRPKISTTHIILLSFLIAILVGALLLSLPVSSADGKAKPFLDAQLHFNMTNEYYMSERYDDCDPWYIPWCPNASANGRTILMLCDWYVDRINS